MSIDGSKPTRRLHGLGGRLDMRTLRITYSNGIFVAECGSSMGAQFTRYGVGLHVITSMYNAQTNLRANLSGNRLEEVIEAQLAVFTMAKTHERPEDYLDRWVDGQRNIVSQTLGKKIILHAMRYPRSFVPSYSVASGEGSNLDLGAAYDNLNLALYHHFNK